MTWTIIKSEWRRLAVFILWLTLGTIVLWSGYWLCKSSLSRSLAEIFETGLLLFLPLLYALMLGVELFSRDINRQTTGFLFSLPISPSRLFWTRYLANFLPVLALTAFNTFLWVLVTGSIYEPLVNIWPLITLQILILLNVHAMIIVCSVLGRGIGGALGGLGILVILLLQALIWPQIFPLGNAYYHMLIILGIIWLALLALSWYLWAWRRAFGKSAVKTVVWVAGVYVAMNLLGYLGMWAKAEIQLTRAIRDARAAGLAMTRTDVSIIRPPAVPPAQNAAPVLQRLDAATKASKLNLGVTCNIYYDPEKKVDIPQWRRDHAWLEKPDACQPMEEALKQLQSCSALIPLLTSGEIEQLYFPQEKYTLDRLLDYLTSQAMMAAFRGREQDFFARFDQFFHLIKLRSQLPCTDINDKWQRMFELAIILGPKTPSSATYYRKLLILADRVIVPPNNPWDKQLRINTLQLLLLADFVRPLIVEMTAENLRFDIEEQKLLSPLQPPEKLRQFLRGRKNYRDLIGLHHSRISSYLHYRTYADAIRLGLALKIYRIEHGAYPEKFTALVPELLPEIPYSALTGESFGGQLKDGGFVIGERIYGSKKFEQIYTYYRPFQETVK